MDISTANPKRPRVGSRYPGGWALLDRYSEFIGTSKQPVPKLALWFAIMEQLLAHENSGQRPLLETGRPDVYTRNPSVSWPSSFWPSGFNSLYSRLGWISWLSWYLLLTYSWISPVIW